MSRDILMPLAIDAIAIPDGRREIDPAVVKRLADSIESIGLKHPITVRRKGEKYILVAGLHRLEAHKKLKLEHVPACIVTMTNAEARMWEIAENLHRSDLTKLQRAEQITEWIELCKEAKPSGVRTPTGQISGGVTGAARELGLARSSAHEAVQIGTRLTQAAKDAAQEAGIDDNQSKLLEVAKEPPEQQVAAVHRLAIEPRIGKTWRDKFADVWSHGTEDDQAWAREFIDQPVMDRRFGS